MWGCNVLTLPFRISGNLVKVEIDSTLQFLSFKVFKVPPVENISKIIVGNGTTSKEILKRLDFFKKEIIIFDEKNTTYRAKAKYFQLFPIFGLSLKTEDELKSINKIHKFQKNEFKSTLISHENFYVNIRNSKKNLLNEDFKILSSQLEQTLNKIKTS